MKKLVTGDGAYADPPGFRSVVGLEARRTLGGRYQLGAALGAGGCGEVFSGRDLIDGKRVAVKLLSPMSTDELARVRREIAALRILRLPGVVQLLDDGVDEGDHFIVMDLVEGTRFPGPKTDPSWLTVGPRAVRLLEALALVHGAGILHGDLKPANVLVDETGRPTILDFGIARGPALGETAVARPEVMGTPRYLAPEQLTGRAGDARADLYAVGVMLFEALSGRAPHPSGNLTEIVNARISSDAPSIQHFVPDLPRRVGLLVDRLLARSPTDRPRSALEALADLGESAAIDGALHPLPRLGDDAPLRALVEAGLAGRRLTIVGTRGAGTSRLLREAEERLVKAGRVVLRCAHGAWPFESLLPVLGPPDDADPRIAYNARLRALLDQGLVVIVDGAELLDAWSAELLDGLPGAVLRSTEQGDGTRLQPLKEADLRPLFHGPDRLLHLQEDGAHELYTRAGGLPGQISAEVGAWVGAGLAEWREGRVQVTRGALDQLAAGLQLAIPLLPQGDRPAQLSGVLEGLLGWVAMAWPDSTRGTLLAATGMSAWEFDAEIDELTRVGAVRVLPDGRLRAAVPDNRSEWSEERRRAAHRSLADVLDPANPRRFTHLVAAGDFEAASVEALLLARSLGKHGHAGRAAGVATLGLSVARQVEGAPNEGPLLEELAIDALRSWTVGPCEAALYEFGRASNPSPRLDAIATLLRATLDAHRGRADGAMSLARSVAPFSDELLERWRQVVHVHVAASSSPARQEDVLRTVEAWASDPERESLYTGWMGMLRYRQSRFAEAAALHERAARTRPEGFSPLGAMLNGASALIEAYEPEAAAAHAREALALARACRLAAFEARAEWVLRNIAYRLGSTTTPDLELADAASSLAQPGLAGQIFLTEAAIAWRGGALEQATQLAREAREAWATTGFSPGAALAEALEAACAPGRDPEDLRPIAQRALRGSAPRLALQTIGLLALAAPWLAVEWAPQVSRLAPLTEQRFWGRRNEVLTIEEALNYCSAHLGRN